MMLEQNRAEFERCRITDYHAAGYLGQGMTVAVLDDGGKPFDFMTYCETPLGIAAKGGHATSVARVIHEVAPGARIVLLPYYGCITTGQKTGSIQWILDHRDEIDIINCSFHEWINEPFKQLEWLDIPVVCAAGNQGNDDRLVYPARYPWTIAVGALEEYRDIPAPYSNEGPELDCLGYTNVEIPLAVGTMNFNGTSAAAPFVAGMLALAGKMTGQEAKQFIKNNCIDYYEAGHDWQSGYGLFVLPEVERKVKIGIDPGHGGSDPGAIGPGGLHEADVNLAVAKELAKLVDYNGMNVMLTRKKDEAVTLDHRCYMLNSAQCAVVVSIHCNASPDPRPGYVTTCIQAKGGQAEYLAIFIQRHLAEATGWPDGGVRVANLQMTRETHAPAVLAELGFISNPDQERWLKAPENQRKLAEAICRGVCDYVGQAYKEPVKEAIEMSLKGLKFEADAKIIFKDKQLSAGIITLPGVGGKTYVELRTIAKLLGLQVDFDNPTKTVTLK